MKMLLTLCLDVYRWQRTKGSRNSLAKSLLMALYQCRCCHDLLISMRRTSRVKLKYNASDVYLIIIIYLIRSSHGQWQDHGLSD